MFALVPEGAPAKPAEKAPGADEKSDAEARKDKYFGWHPDPDANKDGVLSWPEYKAHKAALDASKKR